MVPREFFCTKRSSSDVAVFLPHNSRAVSSHQATASFINPQPEKIMKMNHMQSNSKLTATESLFRGAWKRLAYMCAAGTLLLTGTSSWAGVVAGYDPFFFECYGAHRDLHSFPTRRSLISAR